MPPQSGGMEIKMNKSPYIQKSCNITEIGRFKIHMEQLEHKGTVRPYSYVSVREGVHVPPIVGDKVCVLRQYRYPINQWAYEFPGGAIEDGMLPEETALRELREEAGYEAKELIPLGFVYPSYGYTDEKVYLFAAICSNKINKSLEPLEVIESDLHTFDEVDRMVDDGRISLGNAILCWIRYKKKFDFRSISHN